jgi:Putative rRNA methylase
MIRLSTVTTFITMVVITRFATHSYGFRPLLRKGCSTCRWNCPFNAQNDPRRDFNDLIGSVLGRARRTLITKQDVDTGSSEDPFSSIDPDSATQLASSSLGQTPSKTEVFIQESINDLLPLAVGRAQATLCVGLKKPESTNTSQHEMTQKSVNGLLQSAIGRADSTIFSRITAKAREASSSSPSTNERAVQNLLRTTTDQVQTSLRYPKSLQRARNETLTERYNSGLAYRDNPAIANTALAHSLWASVLRPSIDSAIDATCGNGYDSVVIAKMLFPTTGDTDADFDSDSQSQLLCIDIQQQACDNTTQRLADALGIQNDRMKHHVQVLQTSHAPLPRPNDSSSVGLVVYNLGWLPNSAKEYITLMDSTLSSLVDAFLLVRVGGMVSVMTYPKSNWREDVAVRALLECVALLSSNVLSWRDYLDQLVISKPKDDDDDGIDNSIEIKQLVVESMERVTKLGDSYQSWRVSEHRRLGLDRAPILLTAMRIK